MLKLKLMPNGINNITPDSGDALRILRSAACGQSEFHISDPIVGTRSRHAALGEGKAAVKISGDYVRGFTVTIVPDADTTINAELAGLIDFAPVVHEPVIYKEEDKHEPD